MSKRKGKKARLTIVSLNISNTDGLNLLGKVPKGERHKVGKGLTYCKAGEVLIRDEDGNAYRLSIDLVQSVTREGTRFSICAEHEFMAVASGAVNVYMALFRMGEGGFVQ